MAEHPRPSPDLPAAYVHVPFCRHRCGYCNFTLVSGRDDLIADYLTAIERELDLIGEPQQVSTLFIGGGTPTHLDLDQLERLLTLIRGRFIIDSEAEFCVEANPTDINEDKVRTLHQAGINRISLGAQSFRREKLLSLERDHDSETIESSITTIQRHIANVSIDLIFAAPNETLEQWKDDLKKALSLELKHISTYGLTIEKGTQFWNRSHRNELTEIDESIQRSMYESAIDRITEAGFEHYEVSNFARRGYRSKHNENYWLGGQYFAVGPGAARYLNGIRSSNHQSTTTYINRMLQGASPIAESDTLTPEDIAREKLVFGLRRMDGINVENFQVDTGFSLEQLVGNTIDDLIGLRMLQLKRNQLQLTRNGLLVSDSIWPRFL